MPPSVKYLREDVYTFESWSLKTTTLSMSQVQAVVDVLWDKYILLLIVISLANSVIDMAYRHIYTYDVGLCQLLVLDIRAVVGLETRDEQVQPPASFLYHT